MTFLWCIAHKFKKTLEEGWNRTLHFDRVGIYMQRHLQNTLRLPFPPPLHLPVYLPAVFISFNVNNYLYSNPFDCMCAAASHKEF